MVVAEGTFRFVSCQFGIKPKFRCNANSAVALDYVTAWVSKASIDSG